MATKPTATVDLPPDRPGVGEPLEEFIRRHYDKHPAQIGFCNDPSRFRAAIAGIGGGKTEVGAFDAIRHCIRFPGIRGLVVAPTYRMLARSTALVLRKVAAWWPGLTVKEFKSENKLVFPGLTDAHGDPSTIFFGHAQDADSLRAVEVGFFWIDEAPLCKEDVWLVCQGRIRQPGVPHRGWLTGTPKGQNWVYKTFIQDRDDWPADRRVRYGFHHWTTYDNPLYDAEPDFLTALEESYGQGTDFHRQEMLALFVALAGLVYKQFDETKHVVPKMACRIRRAIAGIDWGVTSPGCILVVAEGEDGKFYVVDEAYERGLTITGSPGNDWLSIATELHRKWSIQQFFADPEDANAILTFQRAGLPVVRANNARLEGVRAMQALVAGDKWRVLENAAPNLLTEFAQYHWREDRDGKPIEDQDPAKEFDHALDPARYIAMGVSRQGTTNAPAVSRRGYVAQYG